MVCVTCIAPLLVVYVRTRNKMFIYKKQNVTIKLITFIIVSLLWCVSFVFLKVLFNRNMENYEKELWKTYVVSMPSAVIIIILGQTLSNRIVWGSPQRRLGEKCSSKLQCLWFEGNPTVKNNNLVLFGCTIESHMRGYFITNHNLVNLWPLVKSGGLQDYSIPF